jgi:hypothetical protein
MTTHEPDESDRAMIESKNVWMFDCPLHGLEEQVLCFRAYDIELVDRWKLFRLEWNRIGTTAEEKKNHVLSLKSKE